MGRSEERRVQREAGGQLMYNLMLERVTDEHTTGERVVLSCNVQASASAEEMGAHLVKMGEAAFVRMRSLNEQWAEITARAILENTRRIEAEKAEKAARENGTPTESAQGA